MIGERLRADHEPELVTLMLDPRVAATLWPTVGTPTSADVHRSLLDKLAHWERHRFGMWLMRDRESGAMVGRGGLQETLVAEQWEVEAGWAIVPERWGQGLATELALASVDVAWGALALQEIVAFALPTNAASRRVMEKSGFEFERDIEYAGLPHVLYRRHRC